MTDKERPRPPGEVIREMMTDRGWTQTDLAQILGRPQPAISAIINGKRGITPETAVMLSEAFGTTAEMWVELEARFRLSQIDAVDSTVRKRAKLYEIAPVSEMQKRGWINDVDDLKELELELQRFFEVETLASEISISVNTKKTMRTQPLTAEQKAWCFKARKLAKCIAADPFEPGNLDENLGELRELAAWPEEIRRVPRVLAKMGIRFVVVEPLPRSRIDGAAFWLNDKSPVIALSLRYDRIDSFWHSLCHEISHVRHVDGLVVDNDLVGENRPAPAEQDAIERRADREAAELLIDPKTLDDFILRVGPLYSRTRINQFANRISIHPGIIVGQLQFRGELSFANLRDTLVKVRDTLTSEALTDGWGHFTPAT